MAKVKTTTANSSQKRRPALSPEAREQQMIDLAVSLAEQQLMDGTASSQVITHYLKLATSKEKLERERLEEENRLLKAKTKAIESNDNAEARYVEVLKALRNYNGQGDPDEYDY